VPKLEDVKLCYCDESGTGDEPIATMVGIVVDSSRMHLTKKDWADLLTHLSELAGRQIVELHTRNFYSGNGMWRALSGEARAAVLTSIFTWLGERKHHVVYSSVVKAVYEEARSAHEIPDELNTIWRFMGFHLVLAMQKHCQRDGGVKGHTLFVFDNEDREQMRFTDIISRPPAWSDTYYHREKKQAQLDQVIDVPYFGDSKDVVLIQVADVASFFLRRYAEIKEGLVPAKYADEEERITEWVSLLTARSIGSACIYPGRQRTWADDLFYLRAPGAIRDA